jgi:hypothetical protein
MGSFAPSIIFKRQVSPSEQYMISAVKNFVGSILLIPSLGKSKDAKKIKPFKLVIHFSLFG